MAELSSLAVARKGRALQKVGENRRLSLERRASRPSYSVPEPLQLSHALLTTTPSTGLFGEPGKFNALQQKCLHLEHGN